MARQVVKVPRPVYGQRPTPLQGSRQRPVLRWQWRRYGRPILIGAVLLAGWSFFSIRSLSVTGTKQLTASELEVRSKHILQRHIWGNNLLTMDDKDVVSQLLSQEPRLKSVQLHRKWPRGLEVKITEKLPALVWQSGQETFLLDYDGSLISEGQNSALITVIDSTNLPVKVGDKVVPPSFVVFCTQIIELLPGQTGLKVISLKVPDTTSEVYATISKSYLLKFDTTRPAAEQVADLVKVLNTLQKVKKTPAEYIDLRVEHKAYYR